MKTLLKSPTLVTLLAALLFTGGLPVLTDTCALSSAEAQTRRSSARRRTAARPTYTNTSLIAVGTELRARLDNRLSSKDSRVGDRFTATVVGTSAYEGAKVTGHVSSIKKSGRVEGRTTMNLVFDTIQLADGRRGTMRGELLRVYDADSGSEKVDEEGGVESGSRGKQTLKRGGIGAAAGAVLGGILGGGKGAAIGLIIGGAAGAGSIAIEGSKELELEPGTEMLIRVNRR